MDDLLLCPICQDSFRNLKSKNPGPLHLPPGNYIIRTCSKGRNHILELITDKTKEEVIFLRFSLDHSYSKFVEIDYHNQISKILFFKEGKRESLNVPYILIPDFPSLESLREKVLTYATFL